jgi:hypothetical protein
MPNALWCRSASTSGNLWIHGDTFADAYAAQDLDGVVDFAAQPHLAQNRMAIRIYYVHTGHFGATDYRLGGHVEAR